MTQTVHDAGSVIFTQLWHIGRVVKLAFRWRIPYALTELAGLARFELLTTLGKHKSLESRDLMGRFSLTAL
ncbi:hypothetical protein [Pseudomonas sp. LB1P83]